MTREEIKKRNERIIKDLQKLDKNGNYKYNYSHICVKYGIRYNNLIKIIQKYKVFRKPELHEKYYCDNINEKLNIVVVDDNTEYFRFKQPDTINICDGEISHVQYSFEFEEDNSIINIPEHKIFYIFIEFNKKELDLVEIVSEYKAFINSTFTKTLLVFKSNENIINSLDKYKCEYTYITKDKNKVLGNPSRVITIKNDFNINESDIYLLSLYSDIKFPFMEDFSINDYLDWRSMYRKKLSKVYFVPRNIFSNKASNSKLHVKDWNNNYSIIKEVITIPNESYIVSFEKPEILSLNIPEISIERKVMYIAIDSFFIKDEELKFIIEKLIETINDNAIILIPYNTEIKKHFDGSNINYNIIGINNNENFYKHKDFENYDIELLNKIYIQDLVLMSVYEKLDFPFMKSVQNKDSYEKWLKYKNNRL